MVKKKSQPGQPTPWKMN